MKVREILEDIHPGEMHPNEGGDESINILLNTLEYLKNNAMTDINTLALVSMVTKNGADGFSYEALLDANESDSRVQELIKSIDPKKVVLSADTNKVVNNPENNKENSMSKRNGPDVVGKMARRALK